VEWQDHMSIPDVLLLAVRMLAHGRYRGSHCGLDKETGRATMTDAQTLMFLGWVGLMLLTWLLTTIDTIPEDE
jgi:hypothetical protein